MEKIFVENVEHLKQTVLEKLEILKEKFPKIVYDILEMIDCFNKISYSILLDEIRDDEENMEYSSDELEEFSSELENLLN